MTHTLCIVIGFPLSDVQYVHRKLSRYGVVDAFKFKKNCLHMLYQEPLSAQRVIVEDGAWIKHINIQYLIFILCAFVLFFLSFEFINNKDLLIILRLILKLCM